MTTDKEFEDFMLGTTGWRTGSFMNQQGLNIHERSQQSFAPAQHNSPAHSGPVHSVPDYVAPRFRPAVRPINARRIQARPSTMQRLKGNVASYLHKDGTMIQTQDGDLERLRVISKKEHLARLKRAYVTFWENQVQFLTSKKKLSVASQHQLKDARQRLRHAKLGTYFCMLSKKGSADVVSLYVPKKKLFGGYKYIRKNPQIIWLSHYDKAFRVFVADVFGDNSKFGNYSFNGVRLRDGPVENVFRFFLLTPSAYSSYWP